MTRLNILCCTAILLMWAQPSVYAQSNDATELLKSYVNSVVQEAREADSPEQKRAILNDFFDDTIAAVERIMSTGSIAEDDQAALGAIKSNLAEKQNELNGRDGFEEVSDDEIDDFVDYVQQDFEQAQRLVISIGATTLIVILLLLLLL